VLCGAYKALDNMHSPPILLTSSVVAMDQTVLLKDQNLRLFYTLESIKMWLEIAPKSKFVVCDGSGFDFSPLLQKEFPDADIESLCFLNDVELVRLHGKGFGEGEIIRYALAHSKSLAESSWFLKCTGKLWVDNYQQCLAEWNGQFLCKAFFSNVFSFRSTKLEYVDTRFYMVDKSFYLKYLSNAHSDLDAHSGSSIEDEFLGIVLAQGMRGIFFRTLPVISGVGGGSGKYYNTRILRRAKERLRSTLVSLTPRFQKLFNLP